MFLQKHILNATKSASSAEGHYAMPCNQSTCNDYSISLHVQNRLKLINRGIRTTVLIKPSYTSVRPNMHPHQTRLTDFFSVGKRRPSSSTVFPVKRSRPSPLSWAVLPADLLLQVFRLLSPCDLYRAVGRVCRTWRAAEKTLETTGVWTEVSCMS